MKNTLMTTALVLSLVGPAFADAGRTDAVTKVGAPKGPTVANEIVIYTVERKIDSDAESVRIYARASGKKERGCDTPGGTALDELNKIISAIENPNYQQDENGKPTDSTATPKPAPAPIMPRCDTVALSVRVFVDGKLFPLKGMKTEYSDRDFDTYDFAFDRTFSSEFKGKTVVVKFGTGNFWAKQTRAELFIEAK